MLILAFDTTSEHGGAALYQGEECLATALNEGPPNLYSVTLFQLVDRVVAETRSHLRDVELFAVANGPGSFTGIRVGLAAAQAWGRAFARPVRGISVLEAMVEEAQPSTDFAVPLLDARRGEFFLGLFRRAEQAGASRRLFVPCQEGLVLRPEAIAQFFQSLLRGEASQASVACVVQAHDHLAKALQATLPPSLKWRTVPAPLLAAVARLAWRAEKEGKAASPQELDAYYLRRSEAELKWKQ